MLARAALERPAASMSHTCSWIRSANWQGDSVIKNVVLSEYFPSHIVTS